MHRCSSMARLGMGRAPGRPCTFKPRHLQTPITGIYHIRAYCNICNTVPWIPWIRTLFSIFLHLYGSLMVSGARRSIVLLGGGASPRCCTRHPRWLEPRWSPNNCCLLTLAEFTVQLCTIYISLYIYYIMYIIYTTIHCHRFAVFLCVPKKSSRL